MSILLLFAFLSGVITILSPCILPVLPIVLSGTVGGKSRPYGVVLGFIASFSLFTLALATVVRAWNLPPSILRTAAVVLIIFFGTVMLLPFLRDRFERLASRLQGGGKMRKPSKGFFGGLLIGASLGLVWTPCVGPILASVISLAVTRSVDGGAVLIILAYSLGTAVPMFAVMIGGRRLISRFPSLTRNTVRIQRLFGLFLIFVGVGIGFGLDLRFQTAVLKAFPAYGSGLTAIEKIEPVSQALDKWVGREASNPHNQEALLDDYGPAPPIVTDGRWFNSTPLDMDQLRGKVVLLDFWTYSCVNCVRTIPHLRAWHERYKDQGLVIVGVHTPEFAFERDPGNLRQAMRDLGVTWPVVQDNDYAQWEAYDNRYWPAHYFIDAQGRIRYFHFGGGGYEEAERVIRTLLMEAGIFNTAEASAASAQDVPEAQLESLTPETYLGYRRTTGFISEQDIEPNRPTEYSASSPPANSQWSLNGRWTITPDYIVPEEQGELKLGFNAKNVFLVIEPVDSSTRIQVRVDGQRSGDTPDVHSGVLQPRESRLYQLVALGEHGTHILHLTVQGKARFFAFTFG